MCYEIPVCCSFYLFRGDSHSTRKILQQFPRLILNLFSFLRPAFGRKIMSPNATIKMFIFIFRIAARKNNRELLRVAHHQQAGRTLFSVKIIFLAPSEVTRKTRKKMSKEIKSKPTRFVRIPTDAIASAKAFSEELYCVGKTGSTEKCFPHQKIRS